MHYRKIDAALALVLVVGCLVLAALAWVSADRIKDYDRTQVRHPYQNRAVAVPPVAEDEPGWNCLTMGNRRCGPDWKPAHRVIDGHRDCLWLIGDTTLVACPDGYVTTS